MGPFERFNRCRLLLGRAMFTTRLLPTVCAAFAAVMASSAMAGCGVFRDEFTIQADSISIVRRDGGGADVTVFGTVFSGCERLKRTELTVTGDSLIRRLVGESNARNCIQMPRVVEYRESIAPLPPRTVTYVVRRREGAPLVRSFPLPVP